MSRPLAALAILMVMMWPKPPALGQEDHTQQWNGEWIAEGTLFRVGIAVQAGVMQITPIESLGFIWTSGEARVDGRIMQVEVQYAGATGTVQAELIDADTAVVFALDCEPEFLVVCALTKDREAIFKRLTAD